MRPGGEGARAGGGVGEGGEVRGCVVGGEGAVEVEEEEEVEGGVGGHFSGGRRGRGKGGGKMRGLVFNLESGPGWWRSGVVTVLVKNGAAGWIGVRGGWVDGVRETRERLGAEKC